MPKFNLTLPKNLVAFCFIIVQSVYLSITVIFELNQYFTGWVPWQINELMKCFVLNMQHTVEHSRGTAEWLLLQPFALWWYSVAFLTFGIRWSWMVSVMPLPLYHWDRYHCTQWVGGWLGPRPGLEAVAKRKSLYLPAIRPWLSYHPTCSLVIILAEVPNSHSRSTGLKFQQKTG